MATLELSDVRGSIDLRLGEGRSSGLLVNEEGRTSLSAEGPNESLVDPPKGEARSSGLLVSGESRRSLLRRNTSVVPRSTNPWENDGTMSKEERIWVFTVGPFLVMLRFLSTLFVAFLVGLLSFIVTIGKPLDEDRGCYSYKRPVEDGWRLALNAPVRLLMRALVWTMGFRGVDVLDRRLDDDGTTPSMIVVAPHVSYVDYILLWSVFPSVVGSVGHHTLMAMYFFVRFSHSIVMNVGIADSRHAGADAIMNRASRDWTGPPLAIFPEGDFTNGNTMIGFKPGAFKPGEPVMPLVLRIYSDYWDWNLACVGKNRHWSWTLRLMAQPFVRCQVEILDTYRPSEQEKADANLYANNVRSVMSARAGVGVTEHTTQDKMLFAYASRKGVIPDFEVRAMKKIYNLTMDDLKELLASFKSLDVEDRGAITPQQLRKLLVGYSPKALQRILRFVDSDGSGAIEYRDFVQMMAMLSKKCSSQSKAKMAFLLCDAEGRGKVSFANLRVWLDSTFGHDSSSTGSKPTVRRSLSTKLMRIYSIDSTDEDLELSFEEFSKMVNDHHQLFEEALERSMQLFETDDDGSEDAG